MPRVAAPAAAPLRPFYLVRRMNNRKAKLIKLESRKPRNPVAVPASQRKAGAHRKSVKAERRAAQVRHRRHLHEVD